MVGLMGVGYFRKFNVVNILVTVSGCFKPSNACLGG